MGRKKKWTPTALSASVIEAAEAATEQLDQWETDLYGYLAFSKACRIEPGPRLLQLYAQSQLLAGCSAVAIANRVDALKAVTALNAKRIFEFHQIQRTSASLRKTAAAAGGPKRKGLFDAATLGAWLQVGKPKDAKMATRNTAYQVIWYVLCLTGARPEETHTLEYVWRGTELGVKWNGRKNEEASSARFLSFAFCLFREPPPVVKAWLVAGLPLPKIGTQKSVASCINSWVGKFHARNELTIPRDPVTNNTLHMISTCPRLRMDNILRDLVDEGRLAVDTYECMIGHSTKTSNVSYRR